MERSNDEAAARLRALSVRDEQALNSAVADDGEAITSDTSTVLVRSRRNAYSNSLKIEMLDDINAGITITEAAILHGIKSRTAVHAWIKRETLIREACASKKRSKCSIGGQGRPNLFPHSDELLQWIKQMRRDDFPLKTSHVVVFIKEEYEDLAEAYLAKNKEESLGPMIRRFIYQHGFSFRRPTKSVLSTQDLEAEQLKFANEVGAKYSTPTRIISERGSKKAVKVKGRTRWERASVLLVVSATGKKLRPLIIFKGQPDGRVEGEVRNISSKVVTAVQKNAWVDSLGWYDAFIEGLWASFVSDTVPGPLALYLDNLKCHVLTESQVALAAWGTETVPLPKNTTSVLQSLDVGVMGPFKQKLRALTLSYELGALRASDNMSLRERLLKLQCLSAPDKRRRLVERVAAAWDSVSEKSIKKAWQKAGL